jgi:hypothetical protein
VGNLELRPCLNPPVSVEIKLLPSIADGPLARR